jgi:hypothetical protein
LDLDEEVTPVPPAKAQASAAAASVLAAEAQAWPADLPEQVRAVADTLSVAPNGLTLAQIAAAFKGRGAWKKSLPRILDTLAALGRARCDGGVNGGAVWRG